jgi:hypothetical protein
MLVGKLEGMRVLWRVGAWKSMRYVGLEICATGKYTHEFFPQLLVRYPKFLAYYVILKHK